MNNFPVNLVSYLNLDGRICPLNIGGMIFVIF